MATLLLDHRGRPISPSRLRKEQATGSLTGVRSPYSPMIAPGLTPKRLDSIFRRAIDGEHADYLSLCDEMERRDGNYFAALQTRRLAVQQLERTVEAASDDPEDTKASDAVKSWLFSPSFGMALNHILDATAKGFSATEIIWARSEEIWQPVGFKHRPQRWFTFDRDALEVLHLVNGTPDGQPLDPFKFIVHQPHVFSGSPLAGGLARVVAALHMFKGYAVKDWMAFAEVFGMPIRIGKYQPGANEADIEDLKRAVTMIGSDAAAVIPSTMMIEFQRAAMSGSSGSDSFFESLARWLNREVNKTVLGSNIVDEDGGSFAKAVALNELRMDIRNSDAWQCADTIQRDVVRPFVDLNFGPRPQLEQYPLVNFDVSEPESLEMLATALPPFIDRGLPVSVKAILEKFGLTEPAAGEATLGKQAAPGGPDDDDGQELEAPEEAAAARALLRMLRKIGDTHRT